MYSKEKDHPLHLDPDHVHEPQVPAPFDTMNAKMMAMHFVSVIGWGWHEI